MSEYNKKCWNTLYIQGKNRNEVENSKNKTISNPRFVLGQGDKFQANYVLPTDCP